MWFPADWMLESECPECVWHVSSSFGKPCFRKFSITSAADAWHVSCWCPLLCVAGTLYAACELMKKQQAEVLGCMVVIQLKDLNGADRLKPHSVFSLLQYWGAQRELVRLPGAEAQSLRDQIKVLWGRLRWNFCPAQRGQTDGHWFTLIDHCLQLEPGVNKLIHLLEIRSSLSACYESSSRRKHFISAMRNDLISVPSHSTLQSSSVSF